MSRGVRIFLAPVLALVAAASTCAANDAQVIYPAGSALAAGTQASAPGSGVGLLTVLGSLVLAAAGGWLLWRGRKLPFAGRDARKLAIEETRSLGSRQYLVVASYEGKKLLLGVCPGRIDLLTPLEGAAARDKVP